MLDGQKVLALIPARGGSVRLPRKNVLPLLGRPLIAWTIDAALASKYIDTVCVSSDDTEIIDIAIANGAEAPFRRPAIYSDNMASSADVAMHALGFYKEERGIEFDLLILLQPTVPLRSVVDIDSALELFSEKGARNVVSVCETDHSPLWCNTLSSDLSFTNFIREDVKHIRSQDLPMYYRINGAIYIVESSVFWKTKELIQDEGAFAYIMPRERSIDIDTMIDFKIAEVMKCL